MKDLAISMRSWLSYIELHGSLLTILLPGGLEKMKALAISMMLWLTYIELYGGFTYHPPARRLAEDEGSGHLFEAVVELY